MNHKAHTLEELSHKSSVLSSKNAFVGLDGFVDRIVHPVDQRMGRGDNFKPIATITEFGQRITAAAGKSANIELYPVVEKLGGNGPILANAMVSTGARVRYVGGLGSPALHPVFETFAKQTNAVSISEPGITTAAEFEDGKILFGNMAGLDTITYRAIIEHMGEGKFFECMAQSDLIALVNWTMIPDMTSIFNALLEKVFPTIGPRENRSFFLDLADPAKRSDADILSALNTLKRFQSFGAVTLGLNFSESQQVSSVLGFERLSSSLSDLKKAAGKIRQELGISYVLIHPTESAACAGKDEAFAIEGPYCAKPKITTGAGDHFNAGFAVGQMLGCSPLTCLTMAVVTSGAYVRTAQSPTLSDIAQFIQNW